MGSIACTGVLLAADRREQDVIVELVQPRLIRIAADARIAAKFQTAVILDLVLHEEAVVIALPTARRVDRDSCIEIASVDEERLAMHFRSRRIAGIRLTRIVILIALRELVIGILLDVVFQIDGGSRLLLECASVFTDDADFPEVVTRRINEVVRRRHRMRIFHRSQLSLRSACLFFEMIRIENLVRRLSVPAVFQQEFAHALLMNVEYGRIAAQVFKDAFLSRRVNNVTGLRTIDGAHLSIGIICRNGCYERCRACGRCVKQTAQDECAQR